MASVNRVGREVLGDGPEALEFWGQSFICDPTGSVIAEASGTTDEVLVVDCDVKTIEEQRRMWPFLRDRRVDTYGELSERYIDSVTFRPESSNS